MTPRPRGRIDHTASPRTATAKGSAGDTAMGRILLDLGWQQIADLARTFPGADIIAFCGCHLKHELWGEVKTYSIGKIKPDSWAHIEARAAEVNLRARAQFYLFTYQRANGRPKKGAPKEWWVSSGTKGDNPLPLKSLRDALTPPCSTGSTLVSGVPHPSGVLGSSARPTGGDGE